MAGVAKKPVNTVTVAIDGRQTDKRVQATGGA
jgi:hypothetical protein